MALGGSQMSGGELNEWGGELTEEIREMNLHSWKEDKKEIDLATDWTAAALASFLLLLFILFLRFPPWPYYHHSIVMIVVSRLVLLMVHVFLRAYYFTLRIIFYLDEVARPASQSLLVIWL